MEICIFTFGAPINWRLPIDIPNLYSLSSFPGLQLINPLLFHDLEKSMDAQRESNHDFDGFYENHYLTKSNGIAFAIDAEFVAKYKPDDIERFACLRLNDVPISDACTAFLKSLRHLSKQVDLPLGAADVEVWEWLKVDALPVFTPAVSRFTRMHIAGTIVETAITRENIEAACAAADIFPVWDTLFMDAISAHGTRDYRKSILYSAMTVETASAMIMDAYYEEKIRPFQDDRWRVVEFDIAGNQRTRKDPIWMLLMQREDAASLLHEGALYIWGRSLLKSDEPLFQLMKRLRSTRNKIVHQGEPPENVEGKYLTIDVAGSSDALNCANEILKWLGVRQDYKLHSGGLVELKKNQGDPELLGQTGSCQRDD